ncbi:uncharacterized protein LOC120105046 [Phoenix dactylifera]|uniref:Uncharacterized protein LOC120105046 n=1 Tax=Phoenix dactylifera TaxID=42345 RepID=A0A8B8ZI96_PHODC|nr:uncharacterized protein LOC120105046 [Phoenix dactylifera]
MVTKSEVLYARFQKRAAELSGESTESRKKAKVSATAAVKTGAPRPAHSEAGRREGAGSSGATVALPCPTPISQIPGRQEAPIADQGESSASLALARPAPVLRQSDRPPVRPQSSSSEPGSSQGAVGPAPPGPAEVGLPGSSGSRERVPYAPVWSVFEGNSALDNPQVAREVFRVALLPADQTKIRSMNYGAFMDSTLCSAVRRGHEEAEARCLASEAERQALQARVGVAEDEVQALTAELEEEKGAHTLARSEVRAVEARLAEAELALATREQEVGNARLKTLELQREIKNLERKAAYHEAREQEAREQAQDAVRLFRESEEFRDLLEEEGVNGLIQGFKDFRNQLRRLLPDFDLNLLKPRAGVERSEAEAEVPGADQEGPAEAAEAVPEVTEMASEAVPGTAEAAEEEALIAEPAIPEVAEPEP